MREITDQRKIEEWVRMQQIRENFDTPNLVFQAFQYEKGEFLSSPDKPLSYLLFLVEGTIQIYGIRKDGGFAPINQGNTPTLLGDMEFCNPDESPFFAQAKNTVVCIGLSMKSYHQILDQDLRFLHVLLRSYGDKLRLFSRIETTAPTVREKLLLYLQEDCPNGEMDNVEAAIFRLRCSRRQIQRTLKLLCESGDLVKTGKGRYKLIGNCLAFKNKR